MTLGQLRRVARTLVTLIGVLALMLGGLYVAWNRQLSAVEPSTDAFADVARLHPVKVRDVRSETRRADLVAVVKDARRRGLKVSIAGSHHSQGGHTYYPDAVVLDMRDFDRILDFDAKKRLLTVESGAQWEDVQRFLAPRGFAVMRMQSSYVFTIGGTLSANAHGRDLDGSSVVESVRSFRLLQADGSVVNVSRTENPGLFRLVIGGYGMFGVILDVTLQVVPDVVYEKHSTTVDYAAFPDYFKQEIQADPAVRMMLVRPNVDVRSPDYLRSMAVSTWSQTAAARRADTPSQHRLTEERGVTRDKIMFDLSRRFDWAKSLRWKIQAALVEGGGEGKFISRNNAMRPPETPLAFLDYRPRHRTDIIQEYYIPIDEFVGFMRDFRRILVADDVNVISSTIRYVHANDEIALPYAPKRDALSIIVMSNIGLDKAEIARARATTRRLVDATIKHGGTHYLTYQLFPTRAQVEAEYPNLDAVFAAKRKYDPDEVFMNEFYAHYSGRR